MAFRSQKHSSPNVLKNVGDRTRKAVSSFCLLQSREPEQSEKWHLEKQTGKEKDGNA